MHTPLRNEGINCIRIRSLIFWSNECEFAKACVSQCHKSSGSRQRSVKPSSNSVSRGGSFHRFSDESSFRWIHDRLLLRGTPAPILPLKSLSHRNEISVSVSLPTGTMLPGIRQRTLTPVFQLEKMMMKELHKRVKEKIWEYRRERDLHGYVHPAWYRACTRMNDPYVLISREVRLFVKEHKGDWLLETITADERQQLIQRTWILPEIQRWTLAMEKSDTASLIADWHLDSTFWELSDVSFPEDVACLFVIGRGHFKLVMMPFEYRQKRFFLPFNKRREMKN